MIRTIHLALVAALAGTLLTGCGTFSPLGQHPRAEVSASKAQAALADGNHAAAIRAAEAAVAADPHNAAWRAMLGTAYLKSGRFTSAATTFNDALALGDASPRTALSLALALIGQGQTRAAAALLNEREGDIATPDLGLALVLAGQPDRAIHLLGNAIRNGENTPRTRQNIAYAYALAGRWREARLMAAQDIPADRLGQRMQEWAEMTQPEAWQLRVARLLDAPAGARDAGQPVRLALTDAPAPERLVAHSGEPVEPEPSAPAHGESWAAGAGELPAAPVPDVAVPERDQRARASRFETAFAPESSPASNLSPASPAPAMASVGTAKQARHGDYMVQLGSFSSEKRAQLARTIYLRNHPELAGHRIVISQAKVKGRAYWRVAAAGFNRADSSAMCGKVKARGQACIAHAMARPLPGAASAATLLARR